MDHPVEPIWRVKGCPRKCSLIIVNTSHAVIVAHSAVSFLSESVSRQSCRTHGTGSGSVTARSRKMISKRGGAGDRFGDCLCVDCANLPYIGVLFNLQTQNSPNLTLTSRVEV